MSKVMRYVGLDVHKHYVMVAAVDGGHKVVLEPQRVELARWSKWIHQHLSHIHDGGPAPVCGRRLMEKRIQTRITDPDTERALMGRLCEVVSVSP